MGMFWAITLWLAVYVHELGVGRRLLDPWLWGAGFLDPD